MATEFNSQSSMIPNFGLFLQKSLNPHGTSSLRVPFYMTSTWRKRRSIPGVSMKINPTSVSFRQDKRITERDTQEGKVFFHWTNQRGQNNDILRLEFTGQTGNIGIRTGMRRKGIPGFSQDLTKASEYNEPGSPGPGESINYNIRTGPDESNKLNKQSAAYLREMEQPIGDNGVGVQIAGANVDKSGAAKLINFQDLWSLTREPILDAVTGSPVTYYITYSSTLFGNTAIVFAGHFSRSLEFVDSADDPFNKRYSFGFTVEGTTPSLDYIYSVMIQNLGYEFMNDLGDARIDG